MIEEIVNRIYYRLRYRKFKKALGEYRITLFKYGLHSEEEKLHATNIIETYDDAARYIRIARKLMLSYASKGIKE